MVKDPGNSRREGTLLERPDVTSFSYMLSVQRFPEARNEASGHAAQKETKQVFLTPMVWVVVETAENMCLEQCMDYDCFGSHLTILSLSFFIYIISYGSQNLYRDKRQVSCLKPN